MKELIAIKRDVLAIDRDLADAAAAKAAEEQAAAQAQSEGLRQMESAAILAAARASGNPDQIAAAERSRRVSDLEKEGLRQGLSPEQAKVFAEKQAALDQLGQQQNRGAGSAPRSSNLVSVGGGRAGAFAMRHAELQQDIARQNLAKQGEAVRLLSDILNALRSQTKGSGGPEVFVAP